MAEADAALPAFELLVLHDAPPEEMMANVGDMMWRRLVRRLVRRK